MENQPRTPRTLRFRRAQLRQELGREPTRDEIAQPPVQRLAYSELFQAAIARKAEDLGPVRTRRRFQTTFGSWLLQRGGKAWAAWLAGELGIKAKRVYKLLAGEVLPTRDEAQRIDLLSEGHVPWQLVYWHVILIANRDPQAQRKQSRVLERVPTTPGCIRVGDIECDVDVYSVDGIEIGNLRSRPLSGRHRGVDPVALQVGCPTRRKP